MSQVFVVQWPGSWLPNQIVVLTISTCNQCTNYSIIEVMELCICCKVVGINLPYKHIDYISAETCLQWKPQGYYQQHTAARHVVCGLESGPLLHCGTAMARALQTRNSLTSHVHTRTHMHMHMHARTHARTHMLLTSITGVSTALDSSPLAKVTVRSCEKKSSSAMALEPSATVAL